MKLLSKLCGTEIYWGSYNWCVCVCVEGLIRAAKIIITIDNRIAIVAVVSMIII